MTALEHSIKAKDLCLWYGKFQALKKVNVQIKNGLITSLIGPSGCGKTTLIRCFNRVNERYGNVTTTGEIKVLDKNIYDSDVSLVELRKSVGMVFQRPNPLPLSVYENVVFGLRLHHERRSLKRTILDEAVEKSFRNLPEVKIVYPGNLSTYDLLEADRVLFTSGALDLLTGESSPMERPSEREAEPSGADTGVDTEDEAEAHTEGEDG